MIPIQCSSLSVLLLYQESIYEVFFLSNLPLFILSTFLSGDYEKLNAVYVALNIKVVERYKG